MNSLNELVVLLWKRTKSYLLPLIVWAFAVKGIMLGNTGIFDVTSFLHGVGGYWFFASLWTIVIIFCISQYLGCKVIKTDGIKRISATVAFFIIGYAGIAAIGYFTSFESFALKYTIYYLPFYLCGYLYGQYSSYRRQIGNKYLISIVGIIAVAYFYLLLNFNFWILPDTIINVLLRFIASITGCCLIGYLFSKWDTGAPMLRNFINWTGINSLEIYIIHFFFLRILRIAYPYSIVSLNGFIIEILNFVICVAAYTLLIIVIKNIPMLHRYLFFRF